MKLIAVGDIHGQAWKLRDLLERIHQRIDDEDRLVFLGDYVDRGPEVRLTIELLIQLRDTRPNTVFLRGNHEQEMMDTRDVHDPRRTPRRPVDPEPWWPNGGGRETMQSYGGGPNWFDKIPASHWEFIEATELEHREGGYIFVHAGLVPPGTRWKYADDPRMWIRDEFLASDHDFGGVVVFGHTPMKDGTPLVLPNKIGIDTAAGYGGPVTAAILTPHRPDETEFLQAA